MIGYYNVGPYLYQVRFSMEKLNFEVTGKMNGQSREKSVSSRGNNMYEDFKERWRLAYSRN